MRKLLILLAIVVVALPAFGQWKRASLFGADVRALIVDPAAPDTVYLGTSSGEVYVSTDGARSWKNSFGGVPFPGYVVDNLVIDRSGKLWAACWGLWGGGVIAVSDDGGRTWERRDKGLEEFSVRAIAIDARDENLLVAGGLTGVYRSSDAGRSWEKISDQVNVESLALDPRTPNRIYVGTWRQGLRSDDGGKTWAPINNGMVLDTDMFSITVEDANPDSLWVATCGWVYNSADRGQKWTRYRDGFNNRRIHDIEVDPCNPDAIYAGSVAGLYRSEDRGKSWYTVSDEGLVINSIALHPQRPGRVILGVEGDGVYVSHDNAKTFTRASNGLYNVRVTSITPDPAHRNRVYATVVFGGASSGVYRSNDGGVTWERANTTQLPPVLSLAISPDPSDSKFVAGTERGFFWSANGIEWTQSPPVDLAIRVDKVVRFNRLRWFAATSEGVFTSRDGGKEWYRLAGADRRTFDLALTNAGGRRSLLALTDAGITLFDGEKWRPVADAPTRGRTLALRTVGGNEIVFIAGLQGVKAGEIGADLVWKPADAPDAQYASVFAASRRDHQLLYLTSRQQREILVGSPDETEWLTVSLPSRNAEVTAIAPDPFDASRIYVGTVGEGVYVYEGATQKWVAKPPVEASVTLSGAQR